MKLINYTLILLFLVAMLPEELFAQSPTRVTLRGDRPYRKVGVHRGNQVRTVFSNSGVIAQPGAEGPAGAWKYDANGYVGDVSPVVGIQLPIRDWDTTRPGTDTIHSVIITAVERPGGGDYAPGGKFWGFEPIPGFARDTVWGTGTGKGIAMSHLPDTWPNSWPDQPTWSYTGEPILVGGKYVTPLVDWNGYFGRARSNADQESYFWMDDFQDEKMYVRYGFKPDNTDTSRRGHAIQVNVRGMQWSNFLAQDVVFWLYNIINDGTTDYDKAVFGALVGTYCGIKGDEWNDDASFFDVRQSITYTWDFDKYVRPSANPQWLPNPSAVGYIAYAFLESPGNGYDGVDNDGDNRKTAPLSADFFQLNDFNGKTINAGDKLVLINKATFARTTYTVPATPDSVISMGVKFYITPGTTRLIEGDIDVQGNINKNATDGIDNDLDGLIDENYIVHYRQYKKDPASGTVLIDTLNPVQYVNFVTGKGKNDKMLDEKRDDGIDNDGDWNPLTDDYNNNGRPDAGEPNFDATDVDESDQVGLTSFEYFVPANDIRMNDEEDMWRRLNPGYFKVPTSIVNNVAIRGEDGDFMYGAGYFPLLAGKTERFSLALAYGDDYPAVLKTKKVAQLIYNANYNFPKPPDKPTVTAVTGDKKVTLYWDRAAENSVDPTSKERDFEGYKIYKGTDPDLSDALLVTNGQGQKVFYKPVAQYDLKNGIQGYFLSSPSLYELTNGAPFYLGSETGVQNSFVDTDVLNGKTYYYAVVAYDRGKSEADIYPSENTRFIAKDATGKISTDKNTVAVVPNAPVAGYVAPGSGTALSRLDGTSTPVPYFEVVDPTKVKNGTYVVSFKDSLRAGVEIAYAYTLKDSLTGQVLLTNKKLLPSNGEVVDGIRLSIDTSYQISDSVKVNSLTSGWKLSNSKPDTMQTLKYVVSQYTDASIGKFGVKSPRDYIIAFTNSYTDSSNALDTLFGYQPGDIPVKTKLNFKIFDVTDKANPKRVKFVMTEKFGAQYKKDTLSAGDIVVLTNPEGNTITWSIFFNDLTDSGRYSPKGGDTLYLRFIKPFTGRDRFVFSTSAAKYDPSLAAQNMDKIRAVPNPYVVTNTFESPLPPQNRGRGERIIYFINLPPKAKVHIYTSNGSHVRTLDQDVDINDGSLKWDLRTKEGLDVAFGVYFYVVEADGVSEKKFGKLAIIK